ncbi:MAG: DUF4430 domain-containing protein [Eubacteriales bacterium]|nr:DUF4430 domain-containing protein [Eubacteriales bacterium]
MKKNSKTAKIIVSVAVVLITAMLLVFFVLRLNRRSSLLENEGQYTCTISIMCDTILNNMDKLDPEKKEIVPEGGVMLAAESVGFNEGETVFDVLYKTARKHKLHFEFTDSTIYDSPYIEGIGNLYEFDCGELSGWMYCVNKYYPNYGMGEYKLKDGDVIEIVYTCDLGADVGNSYQGDE